MERCSVATENGLALLENGGALRTGWGGRRVCGSLRSVFTSQVAAEAHDGGRELMAET